VPFAILAFTRDIHQALTRSGRSDECKLVRNPTPEGRGLVRSRKVFSSAHLTRLSLSTGYVRSEIGMLGCEASPNLYGNRLNLSTRVKEVLVTPNRSITLSRPT
jgi:hypothetical protein